MTLSQVLPRKTHLLRCCGFRVDQTDLRVQLSLFFVCLSCSHTVIRQRNILRQLVNPIRQFVIKRQFAVSCVACDDRDPLLCHPAVCDPVHDVTRPVVAILLSEIIKHKQIALAQFCDWILFVSCRIFVCRCRFVQIDQVECRYKLRFNSILFDQRVADRRCQKRLSASSCV